MTDATVPVIDEAKLDTLGKTLFNRWTQYVTDRKMIEERWMRNLRQVRKIYDPEVLKLIAADRSKAYPGVTQWIVRGTIARLMQMLFPKTEKNYGIKASPLPDLQKDQLQQVLDELVRQKMTAAQEQNQTLDPRAVTLTDDEIEAAIKQFAMGKAERMEVKIDDDLQTMEFITLARKVVRSATIYNVGIARGPLHEPVAARKWQQNKFTGQWEAIDVEKLRPLFEHVPVWDHYVDMTAVSLDRQDGSFDRHILTRAEVEALAERTDFFADRVKKYLRDNVGGNYKAQWWETEMKGETKSGQAPVSNKETRKYEALSYWGMVTGHDIRAAGIDINDADVGKTFHANAWTLSDTLIKLKLLPFKATIRTHHYFVFEDDDLSILGNGQCDVLRDSQMSICETARAALDNMSVIGPMVEVNDDLLTPGQTGAIEKHKTWHREGDGAASQYPAVRDISVQSHLPDLTQLLSMFMSFADKEGGLPPPSVGDVSGGGSEALRTTQNASMFLGAAALPIRDTVRNYDSFTISLISALVAWNMKYDPNPNRDGDHDTIARGSTSLIAKEVLANSLNEFRGSITPEEAPYLKPRALLAMRMKVHDLPTDELLEDEEVANENIRRQQEHQQRVAQSQDELLAAQVEVALAGAMKDAALARKADGSLSVDQFEAVMSVLEAGAKARQDAAKTVADHIKAAAALKAASRPQGGKK